MKDGEDLALQIIARIYLKSVIANMYLPCVDYTWLLVTAKSAWQPRLKAQLLDILKHQEYVECLTIKSHHHEFALWLEAASG